MIYRTWRSNPRIFTIALQKLANKVVWSFRSIEELINTIGHATARKNGDDS